VMRSAGAVRPGVPVDCGSAGPDLDRFAMPRDDARYCALMTKCARRFLL